MSSLLPSKPSRLRRLAATFVLIVASLGTVATSDYEEPDGSQLTGPAVTLAAQAPRSQRRYVILVSARNEFEYLHADLSAELTATWKPADSTPSRGPALRTRLTQVEPEGDSTPDKSVVLEWPGAAMDATPGTLSLTDCENAMRCQWDVVVDLELLDDIGLDSVEVDWKLQASITVDGTVDDPSAFTVSISER
ncbi:hypothetical protein JY651_26720 [Pyxidicoccus parkwayensis]|uniref:Uncharacterized protein n=1 Tax=Pyxidicoccus parkwayensis TaxID=2813578 RepID=A0ABX7NJY2_9BACT|nr:hypothetical protein [Pyxidicoccus parkwaysis]QSQ18948.1 hypothetical protein JY651_26720 [Pyxidicoccus parkwaysis]